MTFSLRMTRGVSKAMVMRVAAATLALLLSAGPSLALSSRPDGTPRCECAGHEGRHRCNCPMCHRAGASKVAAQSECGKSSVTSGQGQKDARVAPAPLLYILPSSAGPKPPELAERVALVHWGPHGLAADPDIPPPRSAS